MLHVIIDPGHGGEDPGAVYSGMQEKNINLLYSNALLRELKTSLNIISGTTRDRDIFKTLGKRGALASALNADFVVSLHCNAAPDKEASGVRFFVYPGNKMALDFAYRLSAIYPKELRSDVKPFETDKKGWLKRAHAVVSAFEAPTCLIEMGFMTNESDLHFLRSKKGYEEVALAIKSAIETMPNPTLLSTHP